MEGEINDQKRVTLSHLCMYILYDVILPCCPSRREVYFQPHESREYQTTWPASWEICMQGKKQVRTAHGTTDWFQIGKGVRQDGMLSPCLFNLVCRVHYVKCRAGWSISWNQDFQEKYQPQICRWHHPLGRKQRTKEPLDESEKVGLKLNIQKTKIMASSPIISWQIDGETMETVTDFILGALKSLQMVTAAMKLKDACSLEEKLWPT